MVRTALFGTSCSLLGLLLGQIPLEGRTLGDWTWTAVHPLWLKVEQSPLAHRPHAALRAAWQRLTLDDMQRPHPQTPAPIADPKAKSSDTIQVHSRMKRQAWKQDHSQGQDARKRVPLTDEQVYPKDEKELLEVLGEGRT